MKQLSEKELAGMLLEQRQHGPVTFWRYIKKGKWRWFPLIAFFVLLVALGIFAQSWWFCGFVFGWAFGIVTRIRDELRSHRSNWAFYNNVIDWLKVDEIVQGKRPIYPGN